MNASPRVAIFWDYENRPPPSNLTGERESCALVNRIRDIGLRWGIIHEFKAYINSSEHRSDQPVGKKALRLQSELSSPGVTFVDCHQGGKKNAVDMRLMADMIFFAADSPSPVTIILITGDGDFKYVVAKLIHRGHKVDVVGLSDNASIGLQASASSFLDWNTEVLGYIRQGSPRTCVANRGGNPSQLSLGGLGSLPIPEVDPGPDRASSPSSSDGSFVTAYEHCSFTEAEPQTAISPSSYSDTVAFGTQFMSISDIGTATTVNHRPTNELDTRSEHVDTALTLTQPSPQGGELVEELHIPGSMPSLGPVQDSTTLIDPPPTPRLSDFGHVAPQASEGASNLSKERFVPLIQVIQGLSGNPKVLRSQVGEALRRDFPALLSTGWNKKGFRQYLRQAEQAGIIEEGTSDQRHWVYLKHHSDGIS